MTRKENYDQLTTDSLGGGLVTRTAPLTHIEGNIWHLAVGEALPADAEPGDTVIRYE